MCHIEGKKFAKVETKGEREVKAKHRNLNLGEP